MSLYVYVSQIKHKMQQPTKTTRVRGIQGLRLTTDFITPHEEAELLRCVDMAGEWNTTLKRRTQHYGYEYDYRSGGTQVRLASQIPGWCEFVITRLLESGMMTQRPDQMIVNEYEPGQGIAGHIDHTQLFGGEIVSVSLGSTVVMDFTRHANERMGVVLPARSAILLTGESRYVWRHGIAARKTDKGIGPRGRRVSLTFRVMRETAVKRQKLDMEEEDDKPDDRQGEQGVICLDGDDGADDPPVVYLDDDTGDVFASGIYSSISRYTDSLYE
jgi:alkylated DNA repair dioxygenase AlkB